MTSILEQRRIEAEFALSLMKTMTKHLGLDMARQILAETTQNASIDFGKHLAATETQEPDLETFATRLELWKADNALEFDVLESTPKRLSLNIHKCRYADMYKEIGAESIGDVLSCSRDGAFCEGYHPKMKLKRTQTIMSGADYCDFRYTIDDVPTDESEHS